MAEAHIVGVDPPVVGSAAAMASTALNAERTDFARLVQQHPSRGALGALCRDVLWRQFRAGGAPPGRKLVRGRARALKLGGSATSTSLGNLLELLTRGADAGEASALVGAFAAWGLGPWLHSEDPPREPELEAFVAWLARTPGYALFSAAAVLLDDAALERLAQLLQDACIVAEEGPRSRAVPLLEALAQLDAEGGHLLPLASVLDDPVLLACVDALQEGPRRDSAPVPVPHHRGRVEGLWVAPSASPARRMLGWLTGWALLRWVGRGLGWVLRWQCRARVELDGRIVRVERWRSVLGREVYVIDESLRAEEVRAAVRVLRRPLLATLVGAACLAAGVLAFGLALEVALSLGELAPLGWGLGAVGVGTGLDLLLDLAVRSRGARVWLELQPEGRPALRVASVSAEGASQLVRGLDALRRG